MQMKIEIKRKKGSVDSKDISAFIKALKKRSVTIGVHKTEGNKVNDISGTKVIDYACYNEFGGYKKGGVLNFDNNPPARPFVRFLVDEELKGKLRKKSDEELNKIIANHYKGRKDGLVQTLYGEIGKLYLEKMRNRFDDPNAYPYLMNAAATIKNKGFDHPLIDTTLLAKSLKIKVRINSTGSVDKVIKTDSYTPPRKRGSK